MGRNTLLVSLVTIVGWAQIPQQNPDLFPVKDDHASEWCAFLSESVSKSEAERLAATVLAGVEFKEDRVATVHITEFGESGDWGRR